MKKNNSSCLLRLTLVMPTYNRQDYALRNMRYWSNKGVTLRVLDGSNAPIEDRLLETLGKNIIYRHDRVTIHQRLKSVIPEISTEYVALMGDDEFYINSAVISCINELDADDSIVGCCGQCMGFSFDDNINKVCGWLPYGADFFNYNEVMYEDSVERLESHMKNYKPTLIYGITRAQQWKTAFKAATEKEFNFFAAFELQFEMCISFLGKAKVLSELMWLRSDEVEPVRNIYKNMESEKSFKEWWLYSDNAKQQAEFIEITSQAFKSFDYDTGMNYENIVKHGCNSYTSRGKKSRMVRGLSPRLLTFFITIRSFIKKIKPVVKVKSDMERLDFLTQVELMKDQGVKVDYLILKEILAIVYSFHSIKNDMLDKWD